MLLGKVRFALALSTIALLFCLGEAQEQRPECGQCDRAACPKVGQCVGGTVSDICGCCLVCARGLGQRCDQESAETKNYGTCGEYLTCHARTDIGVTEEGTCECQTEGAVCGTDGVTYETLCHLLEQTATNPELNMLSRETCKSAPEIISRPEDASRPIGSIMVLDCEAKGYPVPELSWELNRPDGTAMKLPGDNPGFAIQVRGGPEKHMVTAWAQIMRISEETIGTYLCVATNSEGEARAAATISLRSQRDREQSYNEI